MVFQDYALFPHLTLAENIAFGLVERRMDRSAIASRVADMLKLIRLENAAHRYPQEISGGQQQRVALARAVAHPPRVLLMDEPLGALDLKLREAMQQEIRRIQRELKITTVYVTHDQTEAMAMSDRIAVMNAGRIEQLDTPQRIYDAPVTRFAAGFVGRINFFDGLLRLEQSRLVIDSPLGRLHADHAGGAWIGKRVTLAIRPEALRVGPAREGDNAVSGTVIASSFTGNLIHLTLRLADGRDALVELRPGDDIPPTGAELQLSWSPERAVVLLDEPASHLK
jgi:ABC-type Fe3+/spermidine/putrescine transport system ATPase subunit